MHDPPFPPVLPWFACYHGLLNPYPQPCSFLLCLVPPYHHQGTLSHMAPELLMHGHASRSSDTYAFGILMWELYTGLKAFSGKDAVHESLHHTDCRFIVGLQFLTRELSTAHLILLLNKGGCTVVGIGSTHTMSPAQHTQAYKECLDLMPSVNVFCP